jgi:hypothetical protein
MVREEKDFDVDLMTSIKRMTYLPAHYFGELLWHPTLLHQGPYAGRM